MFGAVPVQEPYKGCPYDGGLPPRSGPDASFQYSEAQAGPAARLVG